MYFPLLFSVCSFILLFWFSKKKKVTTFCTLMLKCLLLFILNLSCAFWHKFISFIFPFCSLWLLVLLHIVANVLFKFVDKLYIYEMMKIWKSRQDYSVNQNDEMFNYLPYLKNIVFVFNSKPIDIRMHMS